MIDLGLQIQKPEKCLYLSTYLSRTSIRTQIAHVEVWLYTHVHKHLPVDVKVTKFSYFRAAGKYKDMRTGPHHVFDMKVGKNWILLILFILFWIRKDCFIYSEKKTISCSLDPATNSETRKRKIQDFFGSTSIQAWRNKEFETKNTISIQKSKRSVLNMINYVPTILYIVSVCKTEHCNVMSYW